MVRKGGEGAKRGMMPPLTLQLKVGLQGLKAGPFLLLEEIFFFLTWFGSGTLRHMMVSRRLPCTYFNELSIFPFPYTGMAFLRLVPPVATAAKIGGNK